MSKSLVGLLMFAAIVAALAWFWPQAWDRGGRSTGLEPQTSPADQVQLPLAGSQYVAQESDSCWSIAKALTGVESEENVRIFATLNSLSISQESRLRDVPYKECPIRAGETYKIPANWVQGGVVVQTVEVDNDYPHWKSVAFIGISCAVAFGIILGRLAPPLFRLFRRRGPLDEPLQFAPRG